MKNKAKSTSIAVILFIAVISIFVGDVKAESYGWSPQVDFSNQGPPTCTDAKPDKAPILLQPNHPALPKKPTKAGEVILYWHKVPGATGYNIYYGLTPKNYIYTAADIGDTNNFTISYLANKNYYFAVQAKKGCAASSLSNEWRARPGKGGYALGGVVRGVQVVRKAVAVPSFKPDVVTTEITLPSPTTSEVKGISTQTVIQPTQVIYQAPTKNSGNAQNAALPTPAPKKKGFWQLLLSIFTGN